MLTARPSRKMVVLVVSAFVVLAVCLATVRTTHAEERKAKPSATTSAAGRQLLSLPKAFQIDGQPVMGTYTVSSMDELELVHNVGMNLILGGHDDLDPKTLRGEFCKKHGIKVLHHMTQHLYGKPRLGDAVSADATTIPLFPRAAGNLPKSGLVQIEDELITYDDRTDSALLKVRRGAKGTQPACHNEGIILFWPEACEAEVRRIKDSPNLYGYYVLDDSPGDALSALKAMYAAIRRVDPDPNRHPVCAGYGSAGSLCNLAPGVCDVMMIYWYPVSDRGYDRDMTSHEVQWMLTSARQRVPGIPFFGVYQAFDAGGDPPAVPTPDQLREQLEDFVREGASGLIAFLCRGAKPLHGWAAHPDLQAVLAGAHREIRRTGGLYVPPETVKMRRNRVQPVGYWREPREIPGIPPAWHVVAPFNDEDRQILNAEFDPEYKVDLRRVYQGKPGPIRWQKRLTNGGVVGLVELYGGQTFTAYTVAYATCTVTSPRQQEVQLRFGSDDDAIVWLNGREVWRHEGVRGIERDEDTCDVILPPGESRLLVKVCNRHGMWAFFLRFTDLAGRPLEGLTFSPR